RGWDRRLSAYFRGLPRHAPPATPLAARHLGLAGRASCHGNSPAAHATHGPLRARQRIVELAIPRQPATCATSAADLAAGGLTHIPIRQPVRALAIEQVMFGGGERSRARQAEFERCRGRFAARDF